MRFDLVVFEAVSSALQCGKVPRSCSQQIQGCKYRRCRNGHTLAILDLHDSLSR